MDADWLPDKPASSRIGALRGAETVGNSFVFVPSLMCSLQVVAGLGWSPSLPRPPRGWNNAERQHADGSNRRDHRQGKGQHPPDHHGHEGLLYGSGHAYGQHLQHVHERGYNIHRGFFASGDFGLAIKNLSQNCRWSPVRPEKRRTFQGSGIGSKVIVTGQGLLRVDMPAPIARQVQDLNYSWQATQSGPRP